MQMPETIVFLVLPKMPMHTDKIDVSLRDYFAAAVLPAVWTRVERDSESSTGADDAFSAAVVAYLVADAMIDYRTRKP